jgi:DNA repair protein RecN (Recombination protein N)
LIRTIAISNLGVISHSELQLTSGLNVISGETGAGKTMLLTALQLMLGARADSSKVREGNQQLRVSGIWEDLPESIRPQLEQLGADQDDDLIITRTVNSEGKSRAIIGGANVPAGSLSDIAENLVVIHGQSEQIRLRSSTTQREALDTYGGETLREVKNGYQQVYKSWLDAKARLERLEQSSKDRDRRIAEINEFLTEMEQLQPEPEELDAISERLNRLENVEVIRNALSDSHGLITASGDAPDVEQFLNQVRRNLESVANKDSQLSSMAERANEILVLASELSVEMSSALSNLDAEPGELDRLNERKSKLVALERKFGGTLRELISQSQQWANELLDLQDGDEQIEKLEQHLAAVESQLSLASQKLTDQRKLAAEGLSTEVNQELSGLAMPDSKLVVEIEQSEFGPDGSDKVSILMAGYQGATPRPIAKSASGGELSRIMLAIEVVLAGKSPTPTMIFDEVDSGVGGSSAIEIGRRLQRLSQKCQVVVVTHLAQVAAFADNHLVVQKASGQGFVESDVQSVQDNLRESELARMLSGLQSSDSAITHAKELLQLAKNN